MFEDKEKVMVYSVIAFVCVILLVVIVMIWMPSSSSSIENMLNRYNKDLNYDNTRLEYYQNNILNMLNVSNFNSIYNNISQEFLTENNLTSSEDTYDYLQKNLYIGSNIELNDVVLINKVNDIYIYRITYSIGGKTRYVIAYENEVNKYTLYFSETGLAKNIVTEKVMTNNDVEYKISVLESTNDSIKMKLTVNNNSDDRYEFDFSNLYAVRLITENNEGYNLASVALSGDEVYYLNPNSSFSVELVYQISQEQQAKIQKILFTDVVVNDFEEDIMIYY